MASACSSRLKLSGRCRARPLLRRGLNRKESRVTVKIPLLWYRCIAFGVMRSNRLRSSAASANRPQATLKRAIGTVLVENDRRWLYRGVGRPISESRDDRFDSFVMRLKVDSAALAAGGYKMPHGGNGPLNLPECVAGERESKDMIFLNARRSQSDRRFVRS